MAKDCQGTLRGACIQCDCRMFVSEKGIRCDYCDHAAAKHQNLSSPPPKPLLLQPSNDNVEVKEEEGKKLKKELEEEKAVAEGGSGNGVIKDDSQPVLSAVQTQQDSQLFSSILNVFRRFTKTTLVQTPAPTSMTQQQLQLPPRMICSLPGCTKPKCVDPTTRKVYDYCGRMHALEHRRTQAELVPAHMKCRTPGCSMQKGPLPNGNGYYDYCSMECRDSGGSVSPQFAELVSVEVMDNSRKNHTVLANKEGDIELGLTQLSSTSVQYTSIVIKFQNDWAITKGPCPSVDHIFEVACKNLEKRWKSYKDDLATRGHPNTVEQYYHGTAIKCDLISSKRFCSHKDCGICGISKDGFQKSHIGSNITFMRFGRGFYLAPNSSKCHDYTRGTHTHRAMFLCDVLPGNKQILQTDQIHLAGPPQGYDSVFGQPGGSLNYPELVIYNETSILPRYVIIYQKDGIAKIAK